MLLTMSRPWIGLGVIIVNAVNAIDKTNLVTEKEEDLKLDDIKIY